MELHPACTRCKKENRLKRDLVLDDGTVVFKKGEFPIECKGIPLDYKDLLRDGLGDKISYFTEEEVDMLLQGFDPTAWAKEWLLKSKGGWIPRGATPENIERYNLGEDAKHYQEVMLKCTAKRKVLRLGRRSGKTESICVRLIHSLVTWPDGHCKILLVCPYRSQIDIIFKRLNELIADSPEIKNLIRRRVSNPYHEIEMENGSYIRGFSAGTQSGSNASSVRGQGGDIIILDEMDYLNPGDIDSIAAILMDHKDTQLWASSTPTGRRDKFYEWCHDPEYKEMYFPSMANPNWNSRMELEFRRGLTKGGYIHEVEAEFGEEEAGVFRKGDIDLALQLGGAYKYDEQHVSPGWHYSMGVDWNPVKGTEIMIVGARRISQEEADARGLGEAEGDAIFRIVDTHTIERQEFTERAANLEIIRMNRKWGPFAIYLDYGGGGVNHWEDLRLWSSSKPEGTPDGRLKHIVKTIDFNSQLEVYDPWSGKKQKKRCKPVMVENAQRKFEQAKMELSSHDPVLTRQLQNYIIERITQNGRAVYGMETEAVGDHRLDAMLLALLAFQMEATRFGKPLYDTTMRIAPRFGEKIEQTVFEELAKAGVATKNQLQLELKPQPRAQAAQLGIRVAKRRTKTFATTHDHELDWDMRLAAQRPARIARADRRQRGSPLFQSRGVPRRTNF